MTTDGTRAASQCAEMKEELARATEAIVKLKESTRLRELSLLYPARVRRAKVSNVKVCLERQGLPVTSRIVMQAISHGTV